MEKYFTLPGNDYTVHCKLYFSEKTDQGVSPFRRLVLFCHGFAGHKDNAMANKLADRILQRHSDTALLIFNWPGHGDDEHKAIFLEDCDAYLGTVLDYIRKTLQPMILDCSATSFGGYLILKYLTDHGTSPFRRICLRCPAVVMDKVLTESILTPDELRLIEEGGSVPSGFDRKTDITLSFLESLRDADLFHRDLRPYADRICIAQGTADELVPFEAVRDLADRNGLRMLAVGDADHRFTDPAKMEIVLTAFLEFLELM